MGQSARIVEHEAPAGKELGTIGFVAEFVISAKTGAGFANEIRHVLNAE